MEEKKEVGEDEGKVFFTELRETGHRLQMADAVQLQWDYRGLEGIQDEEEKEKEEGKEKREEKKEAGQKEEDKK